MILKTAIVADTNSNLTPQMVEELDVKLIPMPFFIGGETYLEGSTCTHSMFFEKLREGAEVFTSQPPPEQITHLWDLLLRDHDCILHFPMSSGLSGSCQTAKALAKDYDGRVLVVDDRRISITLMQSIRNARTMLGQGMDPVQVQRALEAEAAQSSIYLAVNTLEYLRKSGRVTAAAAAMAAVLHIKPVLQIQGGKLDAYKKARGMGQAKKVLIQALKDDLQTRFAGMKMVVYSGYTGGDPAYGEAWQKEVQAAFPDYQVGLTSLPLSVCCHTGEGVLGVGCAKVW